MSLERFSTDLNIVAINGRQITDWGESDPPYTDDPIDALSTLRRGQGGNAIRLDRINPGRTVTLNLNPGGPDSAYMSGLITSGDNITLTRQQVGTLEADIGTEGVIVNTGQVGRGGQTITDDQYIIEFNSWDSVKGGN